MSEHLEGILQAKGLTKSVQVGGEQLAILHRVDLSIKSGETLAIVGSSGSGKTTLLSLLAGLDVPTSGGVWLAQQALHQLNEEQRADIRAQYVGFIFQQFLLVNSLTALENVMLPAELANQPNAKEQALTLLEKVGLKHRIQHYPNQLSGGEQQRVAIARAFMGNPAILFADEPTGNLDSKTGEHIEQLLFELNKAHGTTLVVVTHDKKLAAQCQRQIVMDSGRLLEDVSNVKHQEQRVDK